MRISIRFVRRLTTTFYERGKSFVSPNSLRPSFKRRKRKKRQSQRQEAYRSWSSRQQLQVMTDFQRGRALVLLSMPIPALAYGIGWVHDHLWFSHIHTREVIKFGPAPVIPSSVSKSWYDTPWISELIGRIHYDYHLAFMLTLIPCAYLFAIGIVFLLRSRREMSTLAIEV